MWNQQKTIPMFLTQLSRLLLYQTHRIGARRHFAQATSELPRLLRSCLLQLCRVQLSSAVADATPPRAAFSQRLAVWRGVSTSAPSCTTKKSTTNKNKSGSSEMCQVFNSSELLVGHMTVSEAEDLATKDGLKLIDMGANTDGLRSFRLVSGRELMEESKRQRLEKKAEKVKEKELRVTTTITDHDLDIKLRQAREVLSRGAQVKFVIRAPKRMEQSAGERQISQLLKQVTTHLEDVAVVKQGTHTQGEQQLLLRPKSSPSS